jgi:hypothetical protein
LVDDLVVVMVAVIVLVRLGGLVDDRRLGGVGLQPMPPGA